jgi:phage terminase Nu1 subunit (DNA packaging protein)
VLTRRQLAAAHGVNVRTISKWEDDGMPVAQRSGSGVPSRYDPTAVDAWLQAREEARHTDEHLSLEHERALKERAQRILAEQMFRIRERELLPRAEVERTWSQHVAAVRTKLLAFPVTLADRVHRAAVDGVGAVERVLADAVRDALRELADDE